MARNNIVLSVYGHRREDGCAYGMVALHRSTQPFSSNDPQPLHLCITPLKVASELSVHSAVRMLG